MAGVEPGEAMRENYDKEFTDYEILNFVRKFMSEQADANWSISQYVKWRETICTEAPSMALIRNRLGGWAEVRIRAIDLQNSHYDLSPFYEEPNDTD